MKNICIYYTKIHTHITVPEDQPTKISYLVKTCILCVLCPKTQFTFKNFYLLGLRLLNSY